jgi:hypothetical protein
MPYFRTGKTDWILAGQKMLSSGNLVLPTPSFSH